MKRLETSRLILRPFTMMDLDDFFAYCKLETVGPNAGWKPHKNKEESRMIIQGFLEKQDVLALLYKQNQKVIGSIGLHHKRDEYGNEYYELGYVLSTPYEGRGLMTEAAKKVIEYAFLDLEIDAIYVSHFMENRKSQRVIEKCHFTYLKDSKYQTANYGIKHSKKYILTRDKFIKIMEENK